MPGYGKDAVRMRILYIKSEASDTIRHNMLPVSKYPCVIVYRSLFTGLRHMLTDSSYFHVPLSFFIFSC